MASLVKRGNGTYYAQWTDNNRTPWRRRLALKTTSKRTAQHLLNELDGAYRLNKWDPWLQTIEEFFDRPAAPKTFVEASELFLTDKRRNGLAAETLKLYRSDLKHLSTAIGSKILLERLTAEQIDIYVKDRRIARSTQRKRFRVVRAFLNWAEKNGHLKTNPISKLTAPKQDKLLPRVIRVEELERICEVLREDYEARLNVRDPHVRCHEGELIWCVPLFWFAFYTGLRISEIARVKWQHIDFDRRLIYILQQKSGEQNTIPLNGKARTILDAIRQGAAHEFVFASPRGSRIERSTGAFIRRVSSIFTRYRRAAGLPDHITFHSTRHGFCSMLATAGKSAPVIKAAARHSHIQTSMRYVALANEDLKAELDDVFC